VCAQTITLSGVTFGMLVYLHPVWVIGQISLSQDEKFSFLAMDVLY